MNTELPKGKKILGQSPFPELPEWSYGRIAGTFGGSLCIKIGQLRHEYPHPYDRLEVIKQILREIRALSTDGRVPDKQAIRDFFSKLLPYLEMLAESEFNIAQKRYATRYRIDKTCLPVDTKVSDAPVDSERSTGTKEASFSTTRSVYLSVREELEAVEDSIQRIMVDDNPLAEARAELEATTAELNGALGNLRALIVQNGLDKRG
jgi:hypothetical protein